MSSVNGTDTIRSFLELLEGALSRNDFARLILGKYRGSEFGLSTILVVAKEVRGEECLAFVYRFKTKEITRNFTVLEGVAKIRELLGTDFKSAHLFTVNETVQLEFNKKGLARMSAGKPVCETPPSRAHDHAKERRLDPGRPFLRVLGITNEHQQVLPSMSRKWKQINVFLDLFHQAWEASHASKSTPVRVVDFGSGKGYLTFAVYDHLRNTLGVEALVTGIELRPDLVRFCTEAAGKLGMSGLTFCQGDVTSLAPHPVQVMIALHACDTATDMAIHAGVRGGAEVIMCAPCCHKEIRPQMVCPPVLEPMLQFGVHLGQEAEMLTDTLRALWLEAAGYETRVFEFVSLEHTSKNKMILAVKRAGSVDPAPILARIQSLKDFYGIRTHSLETLLQSQAGGSGQHKPGDFGGLAWADGHRCGGAWLH